MDWGAVGTVGGLLVIGGGFILFIVKLSLYIAGTLQGNTAAIKTLTDYLEKQDRRDDEQDKILNAHEVRIGNIETVHEVKGCI